MKFICLLLFCTVCLAACNSSSSENTSAENKSNATSSHEASDNESVSSVIHSDYTQELKDWRANRISALKRPRSWTTLVGLTWLKEGENTFGSTSSSDIEITSTAPGDIGTWTVDGDSIRFRVEPGVVVRMDDDALFEEGSVRADAHGNPDFFHLGALYWTIIKRSDVYGVRIWDTTHHMRAELTDIPHYSIDPGWKMEATILPAIEGETVIMDNAVGQSIEYPVAGHVISSKDGVDINLIALDGGKSDLFLIFSDLTTDIETYPGGRYLYIPKGDSTGNSVIDFNKAYNPPCVFTAFATCLLPPKSNFIATHVRAGERDYGIHD